MRLIRQFKTIKFRIEKIDNYAQFANIFEVTINEYNNHYLQQQRMKTKYQKT